MSLDNDIIYLVRFAHQKLHFLRQYWIELCLFPQIFQTELIRSVSQDYTRVKWFLQRYKFCLSWVPIPMSSPSLPPVAHIWMNHLKWSQGKLLLVTSRFWCGSYQPFLLKIEIGAIIVSSDNANTRVAATFFFIPTKLEQMDTSWITFSRLDSIRCYIHSYGVRRFYINSTSLNQRYF